MEMPGDKGQRSRSIDDSDADMAGGDDGLGEERRVMASDDDARTKGGDGPSASGEGDAKSHAELSNLDSLLSRITGRAEPEAGADETPKPAPPVSTSEPAAPAEPVASASNDNADLAPDVELPTGANDLPTPEDPARESEQAAPSPTDRHPTDGGTDVASPRADEIADAPLGIDPATIRSVDPAGTVTPDMAGDDSQPADAPPDERGQATPVDAPDATGEDDRQDTPWPETWGSPDGTNVLRVLGKLISDLDDPDAPQADTGRRRGATDEGAGGQDAPPEDDDEIGWAEAKNPEPPAEAAPPPDSPPSEPALERPESDPEPVVKARSVDVPDAPPPRPVLDVPPSAKRVAPSRRNGRRRADPAPEVRQRAAPAPQPEAAPEEPQATQPHEPPEPIRAESAPAGEPTPAEEPQVPAKTTPRAELEPSPWMLDQPEFRRSFGRVQPPKPEPALEEIAEDPVPEGAETESPAAEDDAAPAAPSARARRRSGNNLMLRLVAISAALAVFATGGYLAFEHYQATTVPQSAAPEPVPVPQFAETPSGEARSPAPAAQAPAANSLLPQPLRPPRATAPAATTPGNDSAGAPNVTIERTAVNPPSETSLGSGDASRLDALNLVAANHIANYETDEAGRIVDDILSRDPSHFGALLSRGRLRLLLDEFSGAEADFTAARAIKPNSLAAALGLAEALLGLRRGGAALEVVEASIAANPNEPAPYDLRARAHAMTGAVDQIRVDCSELTWRLGLSYVGEWCEAMAFKDAGRTVDATASFQKALAEASEEFVGHRQRYLQFRGYYDGAIDGQVGPATNQALAACAADPNC